jgi:hypothetical protein
LFGREDSWLGLLAQSFDKIDHMGNRLYVFVTWGCLLQDALQ